MSANVPSRLRLLVVTNMWPSADNPVYGGFVARNVAALREAGAEVEVVANEDPRTGILPSVLKYARLSRDVRRHVRGKRYHAVVGHYLYPTAAMAHTAARLTKSKLVLVVHGTDSRSVQRKDPWAFSARRGLAAADLVVTVSDALKRVLRDDLGLPETTPVATVHMGIDDSVFRPDPSARDSLGVSESERVALFVGNLVPVKGLDMLRNAFETLFKAGSVDRLVIVGGGPMEAEVREWASADPLRQERVVLTGRVEQAQVARWMAAADVFVLPSRDEGLGLVLLEAMACGTPCVATRVGGVPEIVDERVGILVAPEDALAFASGIEQVLSRGKVAYREGCVAAAAGQSARAKAEEMIDAIRSVTVSRSAGSS